MGSVIPIRVMGKRTSKARALATKKRKKDEVCELEKLMDAQNHERHTDKREFLKDAVKHSSVYIKLKEDNTIDIEGFDKGIKRQGHGMEAIDALTILLQESSNANFEQFFERFDIDGSIHGALVTMQKRLRLSSDTPTEKVNEAVKARVKAEEELKALREMVRKSVLALDPRKCEDLEFKKTVTTLKTNLGRAIA